MPAPKAKNIDEYIAGFPEDTRKKLEQIRSIIKKTIPGAEERISYAIPAFNYKGQYVIYFAGYKNHIGLYPVPSAPEFEKDYSAYKTSGKGAIQFQLSKPIPEDLIARIVKFKIKQNEERATKKKAEKLKRP